MMCVGHDPNKKTRHAVYDLKYHLVWVPKYRESVLKGSLAKKLKEVFQEIAERCVFEIDTMEVKEDHNIFLIAPPLSSLKIFMVESYLNPGFFLIALGGTGIILSGFADSIGSGYPGFRIGQLYWVVVGELVTAIGIVSADHFYQ